MSNVVQFNFEKSIDKTVEINGEAYVIKMDDDSKLVHTAAVKQFGLEAVLLANFAGDITEMSDEDFKEFNDKQRKTMRDFIDAILGEGQYEKMYELAGRSTANLMPLAEMLLEVVGGGKEAIEKANQYMKNGKK